MADCLMLVCFSVHYYYLCLYLPAVLRHTYASACVMIVVGSLLPLPLLLLLVLLIVPTTATTAATNNSSCSECLYYCSAATTTTTAACHTTEHDCTNSCQLLCAHTL
jgi:hypothetical protein